LDRGPRARHRRVLDDGAHDGTLQLVARKYPLYTYGGDDGPGDTTGHGSGDVWFAMLIDGTLVAGMRPPPSPSPPPRSVT